MLRKIVNYLKAWLKGEDADLKIDVTWTFAWWEVFMILSIMLALLFWIF